MSECSFIRVVFMDLPLPKGIASSMRVLMETQCPVLNLSLEHAEASWS
jgi:hypothetical protein